MFQSAVTISLVEEAAGGPFVYWHDLPAACKSAAELGFDALELFAPGPDAVDKSALLTRLNEHNLKLAAVGTGAGWVLHKLSLSSDSTAEREKAIDFVRSMIDLGADFSAPAIIGSMQGKASSAAEVNSARKRLSDALQTLGEYAKSLGVSLLIEPLNRYESNLLNTLADAVTMLEPLDQPQVKILADLFHMNIEEPDSAAALADAGAHVGHIHFVDSNRRAAGMGHIDYAPIIEALRSIDFQGYLSAEALPLPDPQTAASQTIKTYQKVTG